MFDDNILKLAAAFRSAIKKHQNLGEHDVDAAAKECGLSSENPLIISDDEENYLRAAFIGACKKYFNPEVPILTTLKAAEGLYQNAVDKGFIVPRPRILDIQ